MVYPSSFCSIYGKYKTVARCIQFFNLLLFILTENGFLPGSSGTTIRHNTQITHITHNNTPHSIKHSTQNYTNNKEHTTHNAYNANTITTTKNTNTNNLRA
jgi:hypothetical protein